VTIRTPLTLATVHPDDGLRAALGQAPVEVVEEVARSGIRGRGGAGQVRHRRPDRRVGVGRIGADL